MGLAKTVLRPFFSKDEGETIEDAELILWWEVLQPLSDDEVYNAVIDYQRNGPRSRATNKLLKPAPGDVYERAIMVRKREAERKRHEEKLLPPPPPPQKPPEPVITDEQRQHTQNILAEFAARGKQYAAKRDSDPTWRDRVNFVKGESDQSTGQPEDRASGQ